MAGFCWWPLGVGHEGTSGVSLLLGCCSLAVEEDGASGVLTGFPGAAYADVSRRSGICVLGILLGALLLLLRVSILILDPSC